MVDSSSLNILIADDHAPSLDALRLALEGWGHHVDCAADGSEALAGLRRDRGIQLLITDWRMPTLDGLTLCRRVRELPGRYIHIIVMTARSQRGGRVTALEAGADAFLDKPLDLQELRSQILVAARIIDLERRLALQVEKLQRAHTDLKEESEISETLRSLGIELAAELDRERLLELVVAAGSRLCGAEVGAFLATHPEEGEVSRDLDSDAHRLARFAPPGGEQPVRLHDLAQDSRWAAGDQPALRAYLAIPVVAGAGGALGTLYFGHRRPGAFSRRDERLVQGLAAQAAVALDKARLYRRARDSQRRLREKNLELRQRYDQLETLRVEAQAIGQKLERVLAGIQEAFMVLDAFCRYTYVNAGAAEMAGAPAEELLGRSFWEMFPDLVGSQLDLALGRAAETHAVLRVEEYYPTRDRWYEHRIHPSGEGLRLVFSTDMTESKRAELAARQAQLWLQAIFDQSSGFVAILGPDGRVVEVNETSLSAIGASREEVVDLPIWETGWWLEESERQNLRRSVREAWLGRRVCEECAYRHAGGSTRMMARSLTPIKDESGQVRYILLQGTDVTEQKVAQAESERARDQALLANRMKSEFLANMSHEIRTPLSGIQGMTEFLLDTPLTSEQEEYARAIAQCSEGLIAVVGDVLDLSRIEAGQMEIRESSFELHQAVASAVGIFAYRIEERGLALSLSIEEGVPEIVHGDQARLRQVLVNLVSNAIKFTDRGQISVRVRLESSPGTVRFEVADTGIGIPQEAQLRLFQPFTQVDSSPSRRHGGTGLGLSIVRRLVELMDGEVGCESEPEQGSRFWFQLPLKPGRPEDLPCESSPAPVGLPGATQELRVLVAEDNPINRRVVLLQLQKLGVTAVAVANGLEVVEALRGRAYDLILMDCQMPDLDGYEATRRIRAGPPENRGVAIVAMTAHALKGERQKCLDAGMNDYLSKPTSTAALESMLVRWCVAPGAMV